MLSMLYVLEIAKPKYETNQGTQKQKTKYEIENMYSYYVHDSEWCFASLSNQFRENLWENF